MGLWLAVSLNLGLAPRTKIHCSDPSIEKSIRTVQQLEQAAEPYFVIYMDLGGGGGGGVKKGHPSSGVF